MTFLHDHTSVVIDGSLLSSPVFSRIFSTSQTSYFRGIEPHIFFACVVHKFILVSQVWNYTAAEYPMNKGSQLSVNIFCCYSTVALACTEGTINGLFIPSVIRLTVGNAGIVAGNTYRSSIVSSYLFVNSMLFVQPGVLKTFLVSLATGFKFQNFGYTSMGPSRFPPILHCS